MDDEEDHLPFADLERCVEQYEATLLGTFGERYAQLVARAGARYSVAPAHRRRFAAVRNRDAVEFARRFAQRHAAQPDAMNYSGFVEEFARRVTSEKRSSTTSSCATTAPFKYAQPMTCLTGHELL